jgi:hypothetical protein
MSRIDVKNDQLTFDFMNKRREIKHKSKKDRRGRNYAGVFDFSGAKKE